MKQFLLFILLQVCFLISNAQPGGDYPVTGELFHPTAGNQVINVTKTLVAISSDTYEADFAVYGTSSNLRFQFTIDANNNLTNFVAVGNAAVNFPQSGFMDTDNPANQTNYPGTTTGFVHSSYPNIYDPITNTFYMHYGWSTSATPFTRQVYEKWGTGPAIMPLKMLSFTAVKQDKNTLLKWETAKEFNTAYTNVQRSLNGLDFNTVGKVNSIGFGTGSYTYNDDISRLKAGIAYYRLQSMDKDGAFKYSEIRSVRLQATSAYTFSPNPAKGFINITGDKVKATIISNLAGKKVLSAATNRIDVSNLVKGVYVISITGADGNVHSEKLLKD